VFSLPGCYSTGQLTESQAPSESTAQLPPRSAPLFCFDFGELSRAANPKQRGRFSSEEIHLSPSITEAQFNCENRVCLLESEALNPNLPFNAQVLV
jgi:hypothetical protein